MHRKFHRLGSAWLGMSLAMACVSPAYCQESPEDRTIQMMCRSGLAESAILYAEARRELAGDNQGLRAKWTMRLMECHAQAALRGGADANTHWSDCDAVYRQFASEAPENGRLPWLAWQRARCDLLRAQSTLAQFLAVPAKSELREQTLAWVRKILRQMETLEEDIRRRQPLAARQSVSGGSEAPAEQLNKLAVDAVLMRCEALLIRARLYPSGSRDRIAAATDVDTQTTDVLTRSGEDWPSRDQLLIAEATAKLELGQSEQSLRQLQTIAQNSSNRLARIRATRTAIEFLAANDGVSRAQALLPILSGDDAGPDLALAEIQLALAEVDNKSGEAKQAALSALVAKSKSVGTLYGDYWRNRAEALLVGAVSSDALPGESGVALDLMRVEVRQLLAAGDEAGAVEKLLQFRDNEAATGHGASAIRLASQAAALLQKSGQWLQAAGAIEPAVFQFPDTPGAASAHLLVVWSISQALRTDVADAQLAQRYEKSLRKQLETWPDSPASDEPESWLANWLVGQGRRSELADVLLARASSTTLPKVAQRTLTRWLEQVLQLSDRAARQKQIAAMRSAVESGALRTAETSAAIRSLLANILSGPPTRSEARQWSSELSKLSAVADDPLDQQLLLVAQLVSAVRADRLDNLASRGSQWDPSVLAPSLRRIVARAFVEAIDAAPAQSHASLAQQLKLNKSWSDELGGSGNTLDQAIGFRILAWTGNSQAALAGLATVADAHPRNGPLQLQLSHALSELGPSRLAESSRIARQIIASSAPGSELNLAARWRVMKNQLLAGKKEEARKAAQLLLATQPMESEIWQSRFESLAK